MTYQDIIINHYEKIWKQSAKVYLWEKGPIEKLYYDFRVLEFPPNNERSMWTYATCCMSHKEDEYPIELHIFSQVKDEAMIELLTSIAYYHKNTSKLNLWHTINLGRPWQGNSICSYGLVSLPYLDGPNLENFRIDATYNLKFYWLIPITKSEIDYKNNFGIESLESKFEISGLDYINPNRESVI